jgi:NADPH-dependent glutamate synthase beta subunit-like oxidoreductase
MSNKHSVDTKKAPPGAITFSDMSWNRTGSWRYLKPTFVKKVSPCNGACPAGNDVENFMFLAGEDRYQEAVEKILEESPFPGVCGRVCYHPCESSCNRRTLDEAASIHEIERFVSQYGPRRYPQAGQARQERVAVVGSGPAGLTCAYHLAKLGYRVTVFEKEKSLGGMLRQGIPAYRLPRTVLDAEIERILKLGVEARTECRVGRDISWQDLLSWDAVFVGVGAHQAASLGIAGESLKGVLSGTAYLGALNMGRPVELGERVAIVGGGNTAIDCARCALRQSSIPIIVYRRTREEMPAIAAEVEQAAQEGIQVEWLTSPVSLLGENGRVTGIECVRNRLGAPDEDGRRRPEHIPGSEFTIAVDGVITAVGELVDLGNLPENLLTNRGAIEIDSWGRTSLERVWAGGDAGTDPRMVVHAIAAGKRAALAIHVTFEGQDLVELEKRVRVCPNGYISMKRYLEADSFGQPLVREIVKPEDINLEYFELEERVRPSALEPKDRIAGFQEVNPGYDEQSALQEARRCFHCGSCDLCGICFRFCPDLAINMGDEPGTNSLNEFFCKGCGICAEECPRSAIVMEREK